MLHQIISIKNVGKFINYHRQGDVSFYKLTVIYAGNGHGKTTLCDILRSLNTGDGRYISGRETLGVTEKPAINLRLNNQNRTFANGAWDQPARKFLLFDASFIHQNVHSGEQVTHAHKKNLYQIIVGDTGVTLADAVINLDAEHREATRDLNAKTASLQVFAPKGMPVKDFLALKQVEDVDGLIQQKSVELAALECAAAIQAKPFLRELALRRPPSDFAGILTMTLEGVSADIEAQVTAHMLRHTNRVRESWLSDGLGFIKNDSCPFCGQSLAGVRLIPALTAYLGESYKAHIRRISQMITLLNEQVFSPGQLLGLQHTTLANANACQDWHPILTLSPPVFLFDTVSSAIDALRTASLKLLAAKKQAPFDALLVDSNFVEAQEQYQHAEKLVDTYNAQIKSLNEVIQSKRTAIEAGNFVELQRQLATLQATKRRYDPDAVSACENFIKADAHRRALEKQKDEAKTRLDSHTATVFDKYQHRMNQLLDDFGAGFQIGNTKGRYVGGSPSSHYSILINNIPVDLGDPDAAPDEQCFRNTLSGGDKSTLALSFFIATAEHDPSLSNKILVFDDPFTSQDHTRRTCTQQFITTLSNKAKQVIVLSHDPTFLRLIFDGAGATPVKTLQLGGWGPHGTQLTEWDIVATTNAGYIEFYSVLATYIHQGTGEKRQVAQTIRLLLEHYLRLKLPTSFADKEWLGDMIKKIRECTDQANPLYFARDSLSELTPINDYAKNYHHSVPGAAAAHIDAVELRTFASRAIRFVQRF